MTPLYIWILSHCLILIRYGIGIILIILECPLNEISWAQFSILPTERENRYNSFSIIICSHAHLTEHEIN